MKPLPDLTNQAAMAAIGQRSILRTARNDVCEALRDAYVQAQRTEPGDMGSIAALLRPLIERMQEIEAAAVALERSKQQRLPLHGEAA